MIDQAADDLSSISVKSSLSAARGLMMVVAIAVLVAAFLFLFFWAGIDQIVSIGSESLICMGLN